MLSQNTVINDTHKDNLDPVLRSSVKSLNINYIKGINNYVNMCSQVLKVVDWFDQISNIKFSVPTANPSAVINILVNFYSKIANSIEVKVTSSHYQCQVVAKNCIIMVLFVNASTNETMKKFYKAKRIEYDTTSDTFKTDSREEWTEVKNISSLKIQFEDFEERKESEIKDIYETSYSPTPENCYILIRKKDVVHVAVDSSKTLTFLENYDNTAVSIDISK